MTGSTAIFLSRIKIKQVLITSNLSQRTICVHLKISDSFFSMLIAGKRRIKADLLRRLAAFLHILPEEILERGVR